MKISKPWSTKGVALYPPEFCMVGQNHVFNALHQFRRQFWDGASNDIAGFFVVFGNWGLGKTRLGYELIAEATGRIDEWLLNPHEYVIAPYHQPGAKPRVLDPALSNRVLPLYIRYSTICDDDLDGPNWVAKVAVESLAQTVEASKTSGVPEGVYRDLHNAMHAKGIDLPALAVALNRSRPYDERLGSAMAILRAGGIEHLWVIVDEVETPGDLRLGLREDSPAKIDSEFLMMVTEVIKNEGWRNQYPYVNFLLLCSTGMADQIGIAPNMRRASQVKLEPNQVTEIQEYLRHLKSAVPDPSILDYPAGTLEGAFLAASRNLGWFNVIMASIHENVLRARERGEHPEAWELLHDFAKTDPRAQHVFNDEAVLPLIGKVGSVPERIVKRLVYGLLPQPIDEADPNAVTAQMADDLLRHEIAGRGVAFAELLRIHIDERELANELVQPQIGFKPREGKTDTYYYTNCELSVVGLLEALRAFSIKVGDGSGATGRDFVIYRDLQQWFEQLSAIYPREGIEFAAELLHKIFTKPEYVVQQARYIGMSFRLWREFNRLLSPATQALSFFSDNRYESQLNEYVAENSKSEQKRRSAVCLGLAKLLDDRLAGTSSSATLSELSHIVFKSRYDSPSFDGLRVAPDGRTTVVYCAENDRTVNALRAYLGVEPVHPILVLLPAAGDLSGLETQLSKYPNLKRAVITKRLVAQEEEFLLKYSGRGQAFDPNVAHLSRVANGFLGSYRDDWRTRSREWRIQLDKQGMLISPIWPKTTGLSQQAFAKGYRYMLAANRSLDAVHVNVGGPLDDVDFEHFKQAAKRNTDPPAAWKYGDLLPILMTNGSTRASVPSCLIAVLQELRTPFTAANLAKRFFFAVPEDVVKATTQVEQVLELLMGLGLVVKVGDLYRSVERGTLSELRESASTWLLGPCKTTIKNLDALFPAQALSLLNGEHPMAKKSYLEPAEQLIAKIDFGVLSAVDVAAVTDADFRGLVASVHEAEKLIHKVYPARTGQQAGTFECSPDRILQLEQCYADLSLWEKVSFLDWLRQKFLDKKGELISEIDTLLSDAEDFATVDGQPFPIAPLTLPLKAIRTELETAVQGANRGTQTGRGAVGVSGYPLQIHQYLASSSYDSAWKRLEALGVLVSREQPASFYQRFKQIHDSWAAAVAAFKKAATAWEELEAFLSDAPSDAWNQVKGLKSRHSQLRGIVEGGLAQQVQNQTEHIAEVDLLDELRREVDAAISKMQGLEKDIREQHELVRKQLRSIIRQHELQALNKVLQVKGKPSLEEPEPAETYGKTKEGYETFNIEVNTLGRGYFEDAGKSTRWELWVKIYRGLVDHSYDEDQHADHRNNIEELKRMKLVRSRLELVE